MRLTHVGIHEPGNAGDTVLFVAVRKLFEHEIGPINWKLIELWSDVNSETINQINATDGLVIGGGGLFLKDTNTNPAGWQWNCPNWLLRKIKVPIIVFAVGYNRFRGQDEFETSFKRSINCLAGKSSFIGLRNTGSIEKVLSYLKVGQGKIKYQPCPTIFLSLLYPEYKQQQQTKIVAINAAFDRAKYRYGNRRKYVLESLKEVALWLSKNGFNTHVVCHCGADGAICPTFDKADVKYTRINLDYVHYRKVLQYYSKVDLVIGMRGHSQLIPFGLHKPIISVISHDKLKYFLEDINHPEWGIEISNPGLADGIITKIKYINHKRETVLNQIKRAQNGKWNVTSEHMHSLSKILGRPTEGATWRF